MLYNKPLNDLTEDDIQHLITEEVREGKQLEYKEALPGDKDDDKKEFLADVSAMANASGGDIIFGVKEQRDENGKSTGILTDPLIGLQDINPDFEIRRLENLLRDSVKPRILGVSFKAIPLSNGNIVLVLRVPRSWTPYHVVDFKKTWRFYSRNEAGKYPMDVMEVRNAMIMADTLTQRLQQFRLERLAKIAADETPISMAVGAKIVLHIMPLSMVDPTRQIDIAKLKPEDSRMRLLCCYGRDTRLNVDGRLVFDKWENATDYTQFFRSGAIEAVNTTLLSTKNERRSIPSVALEQKMVNAVENYLELLRDLGVGTPIVLGVSFLGVKGYMLAVNERFSFHDVFPIDRDNLVLPETVVEDLSTPAPTVLRPTFDMVWNACGLPRSLNYDETGGWKGTH